LNHLHFLFSLQSTSCVSPALFSLFESSPNSRFSWSLIGMICEWARSGFKTGCSWESFSRKCLKRCSCDKFTVLNNNYEANVTDLANTPSYSQKWSFIVSSTFSMIPEWMWNARDHQQSNPLIWNMTGFTASRNQTNVAPVNKNKDWLSISTTSASWMIPAIRLDNWQISFLSQV
jgi:hypothetical protein